MKGQKVSQPEFGQGWDNIEAVRVELARRARSARSGHTLQAGFDMDDLRVWIGGFPLKVWHSSKAPRTLRQTLHILEMLQGVKQGHANVR